MSSALACPRCGESNRQGRQTCWVCDTSLLAPGVPGEESPVRSAFLGVAKVLLIGIAVTVGIIVMIPVLLLVTCFGLAALGAL